MAHSNFYDKKTRSLLKRFAIGFFLFAELAYAGPRDIHLIAPFYEQSDSASNAPHMFWTSFEKGALQAARESGAKLKIFVPENDNVNKLAIRMSKSINEKPGGIILSVKNYEPLIPVIRRLKASKIPLFTTATEENIAYEIAAHLNIGEEGYQTGRIVGKKLQKSGGKYGICIITDNANIHQLLLCNGFIRGFGGSSKVSRLITKPSKAADRALQELLKNRHIDSVFILHEGIATQLQAALLEAELLPKYHIAAFDTSDALLESLSTEKAASLYALDNQPYLQGYLSVILMQRHIREGVLPAQNVLTSPFFIDANNVEKFVSFRRKLLK